MVKDAYPNLDRELQFQPLGVESPDSLTQEQIDAYNENGYLLPFDIFNEDEISEISHYFEVMLEAAMQAGWGNYELTNWHKTCRGVWDLVTNPRILDIVQDLLGESVVCRHSHFFAKLPNDGRQVSWHQDASYWPLSKSRVVSVWLAIDDVDEENGAMQVIPGSHRRNQIEFDESAPEEQNVLDQTVPDVTRFGEPVPLVLKAGQASLHSDWILHGSETNSSNRRRCGLALRYLSPDVRSHLGWNEHSVICRGTDPSGHWADHPRPPREEIPAKTGSVTIPVSIPRTTT